MTAGNKLLGMTLDDCDIHGLVSALRIATRETGNRIKALRSGIIPPGHPKHDSLMEGLPQLERCCRHWQELQARLEVVIEVVQGLNDGG